jgi:hypothetical protein
LRCRAADQPSRTFRPFRATQSPSLTLEGLPMAIPGGVGSLLAQNGIENVTAAYMGARTAKAVEDGMVLGGHCPRRREAGQSALLNEDAFGLGMDQRRRGRAGGGQVEIEKDRHGADDDAGYGVLKPGVFRVPGLEIRGHVEVPLL